MPNYQTNNQIYSHSQLGYFVNTRSTAACHLNHQIKSMFRRHDLISFISAVVSEEIMFRVWCMCRVIYGYMVKFNYKCN